MARRLKKLTLFCLRWGIAIVGMYVVISNISLYDSVYVLNADKTALERAILVDRVAEDFEQARIIDPVTGRQRDIERHAHDGVYVEPDQKSVEIALMEDGREVRRRRTLIAMQLRQDAKAAQRYVVADAELQCWYDDQPFWDGVARRLRLVGPPPGKGQILLWHDDPNRPAGEPGVVGHRLTAARPAVQVGVLTLLAQARLPYLALAILIFPVTFIITSVRWHKLLAAAGIVITTSRTFVLNMVGAFYNTFMPGSTGGDVLKAYYASKQTVHRTRAVMAVVIDRIIGLLALVAFGGAMALYVWLRSGADDPLGHMAMRIARISGLILLGTAAGLLVYYQPTLRRISGLEWLMRRLPMQKQVQNAVAVMEMYRQRPALMLWALVVTIPVHLTVALSAMLAGQALRLHIEPMYYFVCVPVIVLAGSIPISPQGAGVMEYFAIKLTEKQGASVSEAFALAMAIRLTQMLWNLTGGILVLRGGYHAPAETPREQPATAPA